MANEKKSTSRLNKTKDSIEVHYKNPSTGEWESKNLLVWEDCFLDENVEIIQFGSQFFELKVNIPNRYFFIDLENTYIFQDPVEVYEKQVFDRFLDLFTADETAIILKYLENGQ